jgi:hypothetical protein
MTAMKDDELRAIVRDVIARRIRGGAESPAVPDPAAAFHAHASHVLLPLTRGSDEDGACLIEPTVRCTHCGYCISWGH